MKRHNIKKLLAAALLCAVAMGAQAQNGFNMPFSQFGIGSGEQPYNLPMVTRMGGVAYTRSGNNFVNPFNPASYGSIERESFVFDMGVNMQINTLSDGQGNSLRDADGNIAYLMIALPITDWWKVSAGLMPYSTVDYESVNQQAGAYGLMKTVYNDTGGVNELFFGSAFNILKGGSKTPSLQVGFNLNYLTGRIMRHISYSFLGSDTSYYVNSRRSKQTTLNNLTFDLGLQMSQPLGEHFTLGLGLVYKPRLELNINEMALIYTYQDAGAGSISLVDTIFPAQGTNPGFTSTLEQGQTIGIGLNLDYNHRWLMAIDATIADWQGMKYTEGQSPSIFGTSSLSYGPYGRYALGLEKMGDMDASTYWGRMSWSVGIHTASGALRLTLDGQEHRLDEWGAGLGVTMPMRKGRSLLTLSAGYSRLGSTDVLQCDTWTFGIAVSSCERWFFKRKYN